MIDFRYHIVSIVAIFIALAVGIVLGSGPLEDDISGFLEDRTKALAAEKLALQEDVAALEAEVADAESYAQLVQAPVLDRLLPGSHVALIRLPGANDSLVEAMQDALRTAGAGVTEVVTVTDAWTDPEEADVLARVTEGLTRGAADDDTYAAAGAVVADSLVTSAPRAVGNSPASGITDLAAYAEAGFLEVEDLDAVTLASSAVFVTGDADGVDEVEAAEQAASLLPLISAVDAADSATVVTGPTGSASVNGLITSVRNSDVADEVSTADWLDTTAGQTVAVLTLDEQVLGRVGHYGTGDGATAIGPEQADGEG